MTNMGTFGNSGLSFYALVAGLLALIYYGLRLAGVNAGFSQNEIRQLQIRIFAFLVTLLAALAALAVSGWFSNFTVLPPRLLFVILFGVAVIMYLARDKKTGQLLDAFPPHILIAPQAFRILMEIILHRLYLNGIIPVQLTFEGYNFDIYVGISAIPLAWYVRHRGEDISGGLMIAWNFVSLAILSAVVVIALLSSPVPFRQFLNEPAVTFVASLPFIWLPGFVVPFAMLLHVLSIRQILRSRRLSRQ